MKYLHNTLYLSNEAQNK